MEKMKKGKDAAGGAVREATAHPREPPLTSCQQDAGAALPIKGEVTAAAVASGRLEGEEHEGCEWQSME